MKKRFLFFFLLFFQCVVITAQDINYARKIIDTLCSPSMHGRGFVSNGDHTAALFIKNEFIKNDISFFDTSYFQYFYLPVNTLPGKIEVYANKTKLIPAQDYLVSASSASFKGTYKIQKLDKKNASNLSSLKKFLATDFSNSVLLIDQEGISDKEILKTIDLIEYSNPINAKAIIKETDRLTWGVSDALYPASFPTITIKKNSLPLKTKKIKIIIENEQHASHEFLNIIGYIKGNTKSDSFIVFTAHYDHLGQMGSDVFFPGANDNASGIALLLNLAKHYAIEKPAYSVVFIALAGEEVGLLGSQYFASNPIIPLKNIRFLINLDLTGTGDDGITVVNGTIFPKEFELLTKINEENKYMPAVKKRGEAAISDHYPFFAKGVPSFYIYTLGGISEYHSIYDLPKTLPLTKYNELFNLLTHFVNTFSEK